MYNITIRLFDVYVYMPDSIHVFYSVSSLFAGMLHHFMYPE